MTDAEIIEAMEAEWRKVYPNAPAHTLEDGMRALLAICAPAIRAQAMEEAARERDAYRLLLDACHDHLHELTAIIPGNDRAYDRTTDLMGDIRAALAPPAVAEKGSK